VVFPLTQKVRISPKKESEKRKDLKTSAGIILLLGAA
jgi:hypothetical protein